MSTHANMVKMTVTSVGADPYTITLNAASSGFQSFADAYGANATVDILITQGTVWEVARNCTYTHSGTTVSRGTFEDSSTGSRITTFDNTAVVSVVATANLGTRSDAATIGHIAGLLVGYSSTTELSIQAGDVVINEVLYTQASATTLTINSTNEIGAASIAANENFYVYAFVSGGALAYKWDKRGSGSDDPTYDATLGYWKHPTEAGYRCIGWWRSLAGSANLATATATATGRSRRVIMDAWIEILTVTGTTVGSASLAGYVPAMATGLACILAANNQTGSAGDIQAHFSTSSAFTTATDAQAIAKGYISAANLSIFFGNNVLPVNGIGSVYANGIAANNRARCFWSGAEFWV